MPSSDYRPTLNVVTGRQARREPQRGPRKHSRGAPKHFHGAPLGRNFLNFTFQNGTFWRTLYFWPTVGPPNVSGPGVANPLPHPFDGPAGRPINSLQIDSSISVTKDVRWYHSKSDNDRPSVIRNNASHS